MSRCVPLSRECLEQREPAVTDGKRSTELHYQRPRAATSLVDRGDEQRYLAYHLEPSLPLPGEAPPDDAVLAHFTDWVAAQGPTLPHHRGCPLSATATRAAVGPEHEHEVGTVERG